MTRKDYEMIAGALFILRPHVEDGKDRMDNWRQVVEVIAARLAADNSMLFVKGPFIRACETGILH